MNYPVVRINRITLNNMKCVKSGTIEFNATDALRMSESSVLGLYGQNGSGKTVVIEALAILKAIFSGRQIHNRYLGCIAFGENSGCIEIEFTVIGNSTDCIAIYKCLLAQYDDTDERNMQNSVGLSSEQSLRLIIAEESLKVSGIIDGEKYPMQYIIQADKETKNRIRPKQKSKLLYGDDEKRLSMLELYKVLTLTNSGSFVFSSHSVNAVIKNSTEGLSSVLLAIRYFAEAKLFVAGGEMQKETQLPINFVFRHDTGGTYGLIPFSLDNKTILSGKQVDIIASVVEPMNLVLASMIPGLKLSFKSQKISLDEKDDEHEIELSASRDQSGDFPLRHESLGIRKIISILSLLIAAYNDPSYVLAVDEFDSSVFEYLLGELVSVLNETGRGQFIFTSHNLRPLEMLADISICFTTTDPENRYVKVKKKATNNLRDMYFRAISLGCKEFELYNSKSKYALAFAFRQAGWEE